MAQVPKWPGIDADAVGGMNDRSSAPAAPVRRCFQGRTWLDWLGRNGHGPSVLLPGDAGSHWPPPARARAAAFATADTFSGADGAGAGAGAGAGVTLLRIDSGHNKVEALAASHPFVSEIDQIQYVTVNEGPCITAALERRTVRS